MGMPTVTGTSVLALICNATAWANYADKAAASPQTAISVALHTADPGAGGNMTTNEIGYGSYARANVVRSGVGWTVASASASPAANIDFPVSTGGGGVAAYFSTGKTGGGATAI